MELRPSRVSHGDTLGVLAKPGAAVKRLALLNPAPHLFVVLLDLPFVLGHAPEPFCQSEGKESD